MAKITSKKSKAKTAGKAKKALAAEADLEAARHDIASAVTVEAHQVADHLRFEPGMRLADVDPAGSPGISGGKAEGRAALAAGVERLSSLQERLFAEGRGGGKRSLLLVVQGMDTSGKGGIMRHVVGAVDPQGVRQVAFKAPTAEERAHRFLWRITRELPQPGEIGVFDRSQYEDVLVVRVHGLVAKQVWTRRYATINRFEADLAAAGTTVVKVMLHISRQEQKARLTARLDDPAKYWQYNPGDVDERLRWDDYQEAYQDALTQCSTREAPWYVVPADHKWYARWAVQQLLIDHLEQMDPQWPTADFDVEHEKVRLAAT